MTGATLVSIILTIFIQPPSVGEPGSHHDETVSLTGVYLMVSVEKNGEKLPDKHAQGQMVRITQDRIVATDKDSKQTFAASYKLNATNTPWVITMRSILPQAGMESRGLVKREGDMIWLIYQHPGGNMPTEFKTKDKQLMVVLKKLSK